MAFTEEELNYLKTQPLARLATVDADGQPDVVPVGFEYDGKYFYIGGAMEPARTRKLRNVAAGQEQVAFVVDDLVSVDPWSPRFLRVYGTAEVVTRPGQFGAGRSTMPRTSALGVLITQRTRRETSCGGARCP